MNASMPLSDADNLAIQDYVEKLHQAYTEYVEKELNEFLQRLDDATL